jgi:vancomycin resistance protein YoaR
MEENKPGKRIAPEGAAAKQKRAILLAGLLLLVILAAAYLGMCAWVAQSHAILPRTWADGVDLSGLSQQQAQDRLFQQLSDRYTKQAVSFSYGDGQIALVPGSSVTVDAAGTAARAAALGREGGFFRGGLRLLSALIKGNQIPAPPVFVSDFSLLEQVARQVDTPVVQTQWVITDTGIQLTKGTAGQTMDQQALAAQILSFFSEGAASEYNPSLSALPQPLFELKTQVTQPDPVDFQAIYDQVYTQPSDAILNPETYEINPSVTGVSFDVEKAAQLLEDTAPGSQRVILFDLEEPEITTEKLEATLFHDLLGQATSKVTGTANRKSNVKLSASSCNGKILMPGDIFSYNNTTGSRTSAAGYLPAPAYVGGRSEDEIGGGICQTSSTIYYAALNSNLKIVERHSHSYAVGYVPNGLDATVWYGSLDFRFENDTPYPIKVVTESYDKGSARYLTVKIYGTKTDDTTVKMVSESYNSVPYETVYKPDASVPAGTTKVDVTPYTGISAKTYRNLYDGNGKLISSALETVSTYKKRDRIILFNPADAGSLGLDPTTGLPVIAPAVTPTPEVTPTAQPTSTPEVPPTAQPTPTAEVTPPPQPTVTPPPTPAVPTPSEPPSDPTPQPTAGVFPSQSPAA